MTKKRALLIVGLALLIAAAGVAYAHWQDTLTKNVNVQTGTLTMEWSGVFTDDDGSNDYPGEEDTGALPIEYDYWPAASSVDPTGAVTAPGGPFAGRATKDVGYCHAAINTAGDTLTVTIENAYPLYYCNVWGYARNTGSVPVKIQLIDIAITGGEAGDVILDFPETLCGLQIDPGATYEDIILETLHFVNDTNQNTAYTITETFTFVNWNEYDDTACIEP